jgi:hypothetical protein
MDMGGVPRQEYVEMVDLVGRKVIPQLGNSAARVVA